MYVYGRAVNAEGIFSCLPPVAARGLLLGSRLHALGLRVRVGGTPLTCVCLFVVSPSPSLPLSLCDGGG